MNCVQAVVLAGGAGTRVRSITAGPKSLLPVAGKPVIDHIVLTCLAQGIERVIIAAGYRGEQLHSHVAERFANMPVTFRQEETPQGTGGALRGLKTLLEGDFFVLNGDTLFAADLPSLMAYHRASKAAVTVGLARDQRLDAGQVKVTGLPGWITSYAEKASDTSKSGLISAGIYAMNAEVLNLVPPPPSSLEYDLIPELVTRGRVAGFPVMAVYDIGTEKRFREAEIAWRHMSQ